MKRFAVLLVIVGAWLFVTPVRGTSQMMGGPGWQDTMCKRMCDQYGKKNQVCGKDGKTYDNGCVARCDKVSYKRGACPEPEKKEEGAVVVALDETAVEAEIEAEDKRPGGEVKWFDWDKGYGAVVGDDGKELYVDASAVTGDAVETLKQGDRVKFDITQGPKGLHAAKVALELTDEQKQAKIEQAAMRAGGELQVVEEQKPQTLAAPKQLAREAVSDDGVYVLPSR